MDRKSIIFLSERQNYEHNIQAGLSSRGRARGFSYNIYNHRDADQRQQGGGDHEL